MSYPEKVNCQECGKEILYVYALHGVKSLNLSRGLVGYCGPMEGGCRTTASGWRVDLPQGWSSRMSIDLTVDPIF